MKAINIGGLEVKKPIIQGGMGVGISLHQLAGNVAKEGGIGVISCAGLGLLYPDKDKSYIENCVRGLENEIRNARNISPDGIIGVNLMVALTHYSEMAQTSITNGVDVIFSGAGMPIDLPSYLLPNSKTKLVPIVSSARAASLITRKWMARYNYLPDAFVLEGPKAGGHLGFKCEQIDDPAYSLQKLTEELVVLTHALKDKHGKEIPIIAAGGIYSGADAAEIMKLGASGVQLGTRFVTTVECDASEAFKQTYIDAKAEDIQIIQSPVGMPGRAIANSFTNEVKEGKRRPKRCNIHCIRTCKMEETSYCIINALMASYKGNMKNGYAFAGANAWKSNRISTVKQVFQDLNTEYKAALQD